MSHEQERPEHDAGGAREGHEDLTRREFPPRPGDPTTMRFRGLGEIPETFDPDSGLSAEDEATIGALRPGTALLVVVRGPNNGARFLLDDAEVTSGRHPDSDIFLDDVTVSRRHAQLLRSPDGIEVQDSGSLNGTYLNDRRIERAPLAEGDRLQVGKYKLLFVLEVA